MYVYIYIYIYICMYADERHALVRALQLPGQHVAHGLGNIYIYIYIYILRAWILSFALWNHCVSFAENR